LVGVMVSVADTTSPAATVVKVGETLSEKSANRTERSTEALWVPFTPVALKFRAACVTCFRPLTVRVLL
jgi:hypothetical protein